jgi:hypothetical protein
MPETSKPEWPATWPAWVLKIALALENAEGSTGDKFYAGAPKWVDALSIELVKTLYSPLRAKEFEKSGPRFIGGLLGQLKRQLDGETGYERLLDRAAIQMAMINKRLKAKLTDQEWKAHKQQADHLRRELKRVIEEKERIRKEALLAVQKQSVDEQSEFFAGYGDGLKEAIFNDKGHPAHEKFPGLSVLYYVLVSNWTHIQKLPTVAALHKWLGARIPATQLGDLERLKGICKRYKIKLAPRGRPRRIMGR